MSVPIEQLGIQDFIQERIVAEWVDDTGAVSIGSCLRMNQQRPDCFMRVGSDAHGHIHIRFSLTATVKAVGKTQPREILLILPTNVLCKDIDFENASEPLKMTDISTSVNAATLHQAGISESEKIIRVNFNLTTPGFVVMKETTSKAIRPTTKTSSNLILGLKSLSRVLCFQVYMRPGYASVGLKRLHELLSVDSTNVHHANMVDMYVGQGAMLLNWDKFEPKTGFDLRPPPYVEGSSNPAVTLEATRSPPVTVRKARSVCSAEFVIAETPTASLVRDAISPSPTSEIHGILSDIDDLTSIEKDLENDHKRDPWDDVDSDQELYGFLQARELSQELKQPTPAPIVSEALLSEFRDWMEGAMMINRDVYEHRRLKKKLQALGIHARMSNVAAFNATKPWCSAILFYDPEDSDSTPELWNEANIWLVSDLAKLLRWANKLYHCAEVCFSDIRYELIKLGEAARNVALKGEVAKYNRQRATCVTLLFFRFSGTEQLDAKSRRTLSDEHHLSKRSKT